MYAATDIGVFRTRDCGAHWEPFSDGLPRVVVSGSYCEWTAERSVR